MANVLPKPSKYSILSHTIRIITLLWTIVVEFLNNKQCTMGPHETVGDRGLLLTFYSSFKSNGDCAVWFLIYNLCSLEIFWDVLPLKFQWDFKKSIYVNVWIFSDLTTQELLTPSLPEKQSKLWMFNLLSLAQDCKCVFPRPSPAHLVTEHMSSLLCTFLPFQKFGIKF